MAKRRHTKRHHIVRHARGMATGAKATGISALSGAATSIVIGKIQENVSFLQSNWYASPIVTLLAGHFIKRKMPEVGAAMIGVAGAMAVRNYAKTGGSGSAFLANAADAGDAGGGMDYAGAGDSGDSGDAGALVESSGYGDAGAAPSANASTDDYARQNNLLSQGSAGYDDGGAFEEASMLVQ